MPVTQEHSAPYAPTKAVLSIVERHRTRGMPSPIDKEVLERSGISDSLVPRTLQALQRLDLIKEDGTHTGTLEGLRLVPEEQYKERMVDWLNSAYADILQFIDPAADPEQKVRDAFRPFSPVGQQSRMTSLFMGLYVAAGVRAPETRAKSTSEQPRRTKAKPEPAKQAAPNNDPPLNSGGANDQTMTEKALEYRLVDLMTEAAGDPEVMASIINVITFLKTKDAQSADNVKEASAKEDS